MSQRLRIKASVGADFDLSNFQDLLDKTTQIKTLKDRNKEHIIRSPLNTHFGIFMPS